MALASLVAISGPKKVSISGPTPSNGPHNGSSPRHINNRYINVNFAASDFCFLTSYSIRTTRPPHPACQHLFIPTVYTLLGCTSHYLYCTMYIITSLKTAIGGVQCGQCWQLLAAEQTLLEQLH